jgi:hypothetical protein
MTRKWESFNSTNIHLLILIVSVVAVIFAAQPYQIYASSNNDNDNDEDNENSDSDNDGDSESREGSNEGDTLGDICRLLKTNPAAALTLASALGYPSLAAIAPLLPC